MRQRSARSAAFLVLALVAGTAGCDILDPDPGTVDAPASLRQGEVAAIDLLSGGRPLGNAGVSWTVEPATGGAVFDGRFVAYNTGVVRLRARFEGRNHEAEITVQPRGAAPITFVEVGRGSVAERFTSDLWIHGGFGYTGTWGSRTTEGTARAGDRLKVWDLTDPSTPALVDEIVVDARTVNDVKVSADGALAVLTREHSAGGNNGITILDLSEPGSPAVAAADVDGLTAGVHNVWIDGTHVYVVAPSRGLVVVDISDPAAPSIATTLSFPQSFPHDVLVRDGLAFLSHWDLGLIILDIGDGRRGGVPAAPVEVSRIATEGGSTHNAWYWPAGGYVFVGQEDFSAPGRMRVVDLSDIAAPREVASFGVPGGTAPPHNFWMDEAREVLYMAWYAHGLRALDVSGELLGELEWQGREVGVATYGGFSGGCPGGTGTCTWAPQLHDGLLYLSDMNQGLIVLRPEH